MASSDENNGRTHEPNLRELTAELDGMRREFAARFDGIVKVMDERDKLYKERAEGSKTAVDAALKAADTFNSANSMASEKAVTKSELNAEKWRDNANEWRGAMIDRESKFASRVEVDNEIRNMAKEIASLRETRSEGTGKTHTVDRLGGIVGWIVATAIALFAALKIHWNG